MTTELHPRHARRGLLYAGEHDRFPAALRERLAGERLRFSPTVRLELTYLHEVERLTEAPGRVLHELVSVAQEMSWTRSIA